MPLPCSLGPPLAVLRVSVAFSVTSTRCGRFFSRRCVGRWRRGGVVRGGRVLTCRRWWKGVVVVERRGGGGGGMGRALVDVAEWRRGGVVVASFHVAIVS